MAKKPKPAPGLPAQGIVNDPVPEPAPVAEAAAVMILQAGPNASDGMFALRISDDLRLEILRDQQVEVPALLKYESVCKVRGPDFGKRIQKTVDVAWLLAKAFRLGLVEWVNRPPAPPRQPRVPA